IPFAVQKINRSKGRLQIMQLTDEICISQRHFERKFKAYTRYTPKEYSRIMKFTNTIALLKNSVPDNLLTIAV
ncbi:AraC family transcriptional regulator, partial [Parabacteroides merdae]|nr:AraC family transcriptional regulator [Parabacteroides merdae]